MTPYIYGQATNSNTVFSQAETQFSNKNYNEALSNLALYDNLSDASKEKAQVLRIQIYREMALMDSSQVKNYTNSVEEIQKMYADGKKVNAEDLFRILKEQQEFEKDAASLKKENLSANSSEINIDGVKIGMNIEDIPSQVAANFDWSQGSKGQASEQLNYVPLVFTPNKMGTGNIYNYKMSGIQYITADDRTRRVISMMKVLENENYKKKEQSGLSKFNALVEEMKLKFGKENVEIREPQVTTNKVGPIKITTQNYAAVIHSKSIVYALSYIITNDDTYTISENMIISDYFKNQ
jgi:hypothetical protein